MKNNKLILALIATLAALAMMACPIPGLDTTAPTVISTVPASAAENVALNASVSATFSEDMLDESVVAANFTLMAGGSAIAGVVTYDDMIATFDPDGDLSNNTTYTATITTGVKDEAGNALAADAVWSFTTGSSVDATAPTVTSVLPAHAGYSNVADPVDATFSEAMLAATVIADGTFTLKTVVAPTLVPGTVTNVSATKARFAPAVDLDPDTEYEARITTAAKDAAGNGLAADKVWTFTTRSANPVAPTLGELAKFAIVASSGITNSNPTTVTNGDMMIMDNARSFYADFTPGVGPGEYTELVNGLSYADDDLDAALFGGYASTVAFINQVRTDLGTAYSFMGAVNLGAPTQTVVVTELGGLTYTRGVYYTSASITIQAGGGLTLDAQGDPDSVWLFVIDGTLQTITAANGNIILANGAQAKNVFWRTAGSTTIAADSTFYGTVFAAPLVALGTGATVTGSLFCKDGAVTLLADDITKAP